MDKLNYDSLVKDHPWIIEKGRDCVVSPDSDGLLCGLLMSCFLNWKIKGFYDTKLLILDKSISPEDAVYLDVEIFRKNTKSMGQHMLIPHKKYFPKNWDNFNCCISPNNIRNFDYYNNFNSKYPFGTIHFLLSIVSNHFDVTYDKNITAPLLYTDGTFKNILNYPENCISWFEYMNSGKDNILRKVFFNEKRTLYDSMMMMKGFFENIRNCSGEKSGGEKIKLSDNKGATYNIELDAKGNYYISKDARDKAHRILDMFANHTGWKFINKLWTWEGMKKYQYSKMTLDKITSYKRRNAIIEGKNPLSFAITARTRLEYTLDE